MTSKTVSIDGDRLRTIARLALVKPNGLTSVDSRDLLEILRLAAIGMDTEAARVSAKNGGLGGWQCPACRTWTYLSSQCKCGHKRGSDETSGKQLYFWTAKGMCKTDAHMEGSTYVRSEQSAQEPRETEALRDAERYRWLRKGNDYQHEGPMLVLCEQEHIESDERPFWVLSEAALDTAVDAARGSSVEPRETDGYPTWQCPNCGAVDEFNVQHDTLPNENNRVVIMITCRICELKCTDGRSETGSPVEPSEQLPTETGLRPGELAQLRRIDAAARFYVDSVKPGSGVAWENLMNALFDGRPEETLARPEMPGRCIVTEEQAKEPMAFRHWSKDPLIPYRDCHCDTCVEVRKPENGDGDV